MNNQERIKIILKLFVIKKEAHSVSIFKNIIFDQHRQLFFLKLLYSTLLFLLTDWLLIDLLKDTSKGGDCMGANFLLVFLDSSLNILHSCDTVTLYFMIV